MTPARCIALAIALASLGSHAGQLMRGAVSITAPCFSNHFILDEPCTSSWRLASRGLADLDVHVLQADPRNGTTLYAGGKTGLFKSVDGGDSWTMTGLGLITQAVQDTAAASQAFPGLPSSFVAGSIVTSVAVDFTRPQTIYAATVRDRASWFGQRRLFKSTDGGETWTDNVSPMISGVDNVHSLVIAPSDPSTIYLSDYDDVMGDTWSPMVRSTDGAASWDYVPSLAYVVMNVLAVDPVDSRTLYGGTQAYPPEFTNLPDGVLKSTDGGETWQPTTLVGPGISALAIAATAPQTLYAATYNWPAATGNALYRSTDGGLVWERMDTGLGDVPLTAVVVDGAHSNQVYAAGFGAGVARTVDGGTTWTVLNDGLGSLFVRTLLVVPGPTTAVYAGTRSGVFKLVE